MESILQAREKCVRFENLLDVFAQIDTSKVNSRVLEALVKSGAFYSLEPNRKKILEGIDRILSLAQAEKSMHRENQVSFFDLLSEEEEKSRTKVELPDVADWKSKNRLKFEKEALGFYISGHPLNHFSKEIHSFAKITRTSDLKEEGRRFQNRESVNLTGVVAANLVRLTKKNNEKWSILTLEDLWGTIDVMVFSKVFETARAILDNEEFDDPVFVAGYLNTNDESVKVVVRSITTLPAIRAERSASVSIDPPADVAPAELESIKNLIHHPGNCAVSLSLIMENACRVQIGLREKIKADERLAADLEEIVPLENLAFRYAAQAPERAGRAGSLRTSACERPLISFRERAV
ncbi:MAG: hypothetical protein GY866_31345 [Proteobacteria bacterium]|nr:hypothetical protein [Pseudomonadota bacterium]